MPLGNARAETCKMFKRFGSIEKFQGQLVDLCMLP